MRFIAFKRLFFVFMVAAQSAATYAWDNNHNGLWDELETLRVSDNLEMDWVESAQKRFRDLTVSHKIDQTLTAGLDCDRLAEHPYEPQKRFDGVMLENIQSKEAISACQLAVQTFPINSKWQYQLGRVLLADMQCDRAYQHFLQAMILNDPRGAYGLGGIYDAEEKPSCDHNDQQAFYWYQKAAEQGYVVAQYLRGVAYANGRGVPQDDKQAVYWYQKAAEQGDADAQNDLGVSYANGHGVPQDDKQAVYWFQKATDQGNAMAQYNLGVSYANGHGVPQDDKQAVYWYQKAAEQGYAVAQSFLGVMYGNGRGVPKDYKQAVSWYQKAAEQGYADSQISLGLSYEHGRGVSQDYKQAVSWYQKAAEQGYAVAQSFLGVMYANGRGVPKNEKQAIYWYQKAAEQGYANAQNNLGVSYAEGRGVPQDDKRAVYWFQKAAEQGEAAAQNYLGALYAEGRGVPKDYKQAVSWFQKAAEQSLALAQSFLGVMYENGHGVPKDEQQAVYWYQKAAEQGDANAQNNLGTSYAEGRGVPQDDKRAVYWYQKAAEQGDADAQNNLVVMYASDIDVPRYDKQAVYWYQKAAEQGDVDAQNNLVAMYVNGFGVPQDDKQAFYWFKKAAEQYQKAAEQYQKAAEQGDATAQNNLGVMYANGRGVPQDDKRAVYWYQKAAEQGNAKAQNNLGDAYDSAVGVQQDAQKAAQWYRKALIQGNKERYSSLINNYSQLIAQTGCQAIPQIIAEIDETEATIWTFLEDENVADWHKIEAVCSLVNSQTTDVVIRLVSYLKKLGKDSSVKIAVIDILGNLDAPQAVAYIVDNLSDPQVMRVFVNSLAKIIDNESNDNESYSYKIAYRTLIKIGVPVVKPLLIERLRSDDYDTNRKILKVLTGMGESAIEPLISLSQPGNWLDVRLEAIEVLGQLGNIQAVDSLIQNLSHWDYEIRKSAALALGELGDLRAVEPLIQRLEDWESSTRQAVATALRQLQENRAVRPLLQSLKKEDDNKVLQSIMGALVSLSNDQQTIKLLIGLFGDEDDKVRQRALETVSQISLSSTEIKVLLSALKDINGNVRRGAASILVQGLFLINAKDVVRYVKKSGNDQLVVKINTDEVVDHLMTSVKQGELFVLDGLVDGIINGLSQSFHKGNKIYRQTDIFTLLMSKLTDQNSDDIRLRIIKALGWLGDRQAVLPLIEGLEKTRETFQIQVEIINALGRLGDPRSVRPLLKKLNSLSIPVRRATIEALEKLGDHHSIEYLIPELDDTKEEIRLAAAKALTTLAEDHCVLEAFLLRLTDKSHKVHKQLISGIKKLIPYRQSLVPLELLSHHPQLLEQIIALLEENEEAQFVGIHLLDWLGDKRAIGPLQQVLEKPKVAVGLENAIEVAKSLWKTFDNFQGIQILLEYNRDDIREALAENFSDIIAEQLGSASSHFFLQRIIDLETFYYCPLAILGTTPEKAQREAQLSVLDKSISFDYSPMVAEAWTEHLPLMINDPDLLNLLLNRLKNKNHDVYQGIIGILMDNHQFVQTLIAQLDDSDPKKRMGAVGVLGILNDLELIKKHLLPKIDDLEAHVRFKVIKTLGRFNEPNLIKKHLLPRIDDSDVQVRRAVLDTLVKIGEIQIVINQIDKPDMALDVSNALMASNDLKKVIKLVKKHLEETVDNPDTRWMLIQILVKLTLTMENESSELPTLVSALLNDSSAYTRLAVVDTLKQFGDKLAVEPLIVRLNDSNHEVRAAVVKALGEIGDKRAIEPLITRLNDSSPKFQGDIFNTFLALGTLLTDCDSCDCDSSDLEILFENSDDEESYLFMLFDTLNDDEPFWCLHDDAKILSHQIVKSLSLLLEGKNAEIRRLTARLLGLLGFISGNLFTIEPLIAKLNDPDERVRLAVVSIFGKLSDKRAIEPLIAKLNDPDERVCLAVVSALAKFGDKRAIEPLIAKLNDPDERVRLAVVSALGKFGDKQAIKALQLKLKEKDYQLHESIVLALAKLGDQQALKDWITMFLSHYWGYEMTQFELREPLITEKFRLFSEKQKQEYFHAYAVIQDNQNIITPLIPYLIDREHEIRGEVFNLIVELGDKAIEPLLTRFTKEPFWIRETVLRMLEKIGNPRIAEPLITHLADKEPKIREMVAQILGQLGDTRAIYPLMAQLDDSDSWVRAKVASALGYLGAHQAVKPLIVKLDDPDRLVRKSVVNALAKLGDSQAILPLENRLQKEDNSCLRRTIIAIIEQMSGASAPQSKK